MRAVSVEDFTGICVPTFFVNRIVAAQTMGPTIRFYLAAQADGLPTPLPEVCLIWDTGGLMANMDAVESAIRRATAYRLTS